MKILLGVISSDGEFMSFNASSVSFGDFQNTNIDPKVVSYAVLHALYSSTEKSSDPINDVVDCYVPFLIASCEEQIGSQLDLEELQSSVKSKTALEIPIYTIEHLLPILQEKQIIRFDKFAKVYLVNENISGSVDNLSEIRIDSEVDAIDRSFAEKADELGISEALSSKSWAEALIKFMRANKSDGFPASKEFRDVLVTDLEALESYAVAELIRQFNEIESPIYQAIVHIYVGVLIELFVMSLNSFGDVQDYPNLHVYYDTTILLRLLGTSGKLMHSATTEFHRYLEDLKIKSEFFSNNEDEVSNVLSTIIGRKDFGDYIYGETGDAISRGEVSIADIRALEQVFVEKLSEKGVFPAKYELSGYQKHVSGQIDESKFEDEIIAEAKKRGRNYSSDNAKNDAISLGHVIRMRNSRPVRDLSEMRGLFVTNNRLLSQFSRRFAVREGHLKWFEIPPVLHISQACTIFWLAKDREISEKNASGELLANCYEALRPDPEFYQALFQKIEEYENFEEISPAVVTTLRRIAKQDSLGRTAILHKLSAAELLAKAQEEAEKSEQQNREKFELELENEVNSAVVSEKKQFQAGLAKKNRDKAETIADNIVRTFEIGLLAVAVFLIILQLFNLHSFGNLRSLVSIGVVIITIFSTLDLFGYSFPKALFRKARVSLANKIYRLLYE